MEDRWFVSPHEVRVLLIRTKEAVGSKRDDGLYSVEKEAVQRPCPI